MQPAFRVCHIALVNAEDCVFCRIATGQVGCHAVYEGERVLAFLDRGPIRPGHTQIIPRAHYPYYDDLPAELATEIVQLGQALAKVLKQIHGVGRVAFAFTGGDVAHAHAHVVPMFAKDDITSRRYIVEQAVTYRPIPRAPDNAQAAMARTLRATLERMDSRD